MRSEYYILAADGKTPVKAELLEWGLWFGQRANRRVAFDELPTGVQVSTVFLGLDHNYGDGAPVLWETMIFGGEHDEYQERYDSYDDAVAGHARALALARES